MRSFALLSLSTVLAFAACNEQEPATSATDTTTTGTTTAPEATTETPDATTTTTTTGETTTTTTGVTTAVPTTGPSMETGTTGTTTTTTTTGEVETTDTTTEGVVVPTMNGPYESCSNEMDVGCEGDAVCVDASSTNGNVKGSFCAPRCMGMNSCPGLADLDPDVQAICAFDTNGDMKADICALLCNTANDDCPEGSTCEDIGIPEMMMMKFGVCTWPA